MHARKTDMTRQYVFGKLRGDLIQELVRRDREEAERARDRTRPSPRATAKNRPSARSITSGRTSR